jgi:dihydroorotase-like cyclic amidohydrolase
MNVIDSISSQHDPIHENHKSLADGSFPNSVSGVTSAGFLLQSVWTRLKKGLVYKAR